MVDEVARDIARQWNLAPHPEGGFYRETYRSATRAQPDGWPASRALGTSILFLLPAGVRLTRHRVRGDELWLWQGGGTIALNIDDMTKLVGPDRAAGHELQVLVPGGAWQSATPIADTWALAACVVMPGFEFADFEMANDAPER